MAENQVTECKPFLGILQLAVPQPDKRHVVLPRELPPCFWVLAAKY